MRRVGTAAAAIISMAVGGFVLLEPLNAQVVSGKAAARLNAAAVRPPVIVRMGATTVDTVHARVDSARLRRGEVIVARIPDVAPTRAVAPNRRFLPLLLVTGDAKGEQALTLRPYVDWEELRFSGGAFRGEVVLALIDTLKPERSDSLDTPIWFRVSAVGGATVTPRDIQVRHASLPPVSARITATTAGDSVRVRVLPALTGEPIEVLIPVSRPGIQLKATTSTLPGFGLAQTDLKVTLPVEAGRTRRDVTLSARLGTPEPSGLTLRGDSVGSVKIRSTGVGRDTVFATSGPFKSNPLELTYAAPVSFLIAAVLGGLVGSFVAASGAKRRGGRTSKPAYFVSGIASALLFAVMTAIGVNVTGVDVPPGAAEAGVFVVASLGAILGLPGLARALPKFGELLAGGEKR